MEGGDGTRCRSRGLRAQRPARQPRERDRWGSRPTHSARGRNGRWLQTERKRAALRTRHRHTLPPQTHLAALDVIIGLVLVVRRWLRRVWLLNQQVIVIQAHLPAVHQLRTHPMRGRRQHQHQHIDSQTTEARSERTVLAANRRSRLGRRVSAASCRSPRKTAQYLYLARGPTTHACQPRGSGHARYAADACGCVGLMAEEVRCCLPALATAASAPGSARLC